jgi:2-polyprenyl-6-hydroxyphenyl methylase/3-demethylubiquinone-9 3-methyltransferase
LTKPVGEGASAEHRGQIERGERFAFGKNWTSFLQVLDESRIEAAQSGLVQMLGTDELRGKSFLDIGSGSGLSSLVARRLGAKVTSFDYDPASVACTAELRRRYFPDDAQWKVEQGSALDAGYLAGLGAFDVVYSWGVLHHTGEMWRALELAGQRVREGGLLLVAIYNDQGAWSRRWGKIKKFYGGGRLQRAVVAGMFIPFWIGKGLAADLVWTRNPWRRYRDYQNQRGMSVVHDWIDWLGGYPFEVATPGAILDFYLARGFGLRRLRTAGGSVGCNEFLFRQESARG